MSVERTKVARVAAPVAVLLAVTIALLVVRAGLREDEPSSRPAAAGPLTDGAAVIARSGDTLEDIARTAGTRGDDRAAQPADRSGGAARRSTHPGGAGMTATAVDYAGSA